MEDVVCEIWRKVDAMKSTYIERKSRQHDIRRPPRNSDDSDHESIYSGGEGTRSHWNQATGIKPLESSHTSRRPVDA